MGLMERRKEIIGSALVFTVFFATLTALRVWNLNPSTSVQSTIVQGTTILVISVVAYYGYRGGDFLGGWILSYGPAQAFTLNLFLAGPTAKVMPAIGYAIIGAIIISGVLAVVGSLFGAGLILVTGKEGAAHQS